MANNNSIKFTDRTISDFKSKLKGGGARSNLFEVELNFPSIVTGVTPDDTYRFLIKAAQLPASSLSTIPIPFRGRTLKIAGDRSFDPWTITVINDTEFTIRNAFERWSNYINKHDDNSGIVTPANYQSEMRVVQLGRGLVDGTIAGKDSAIPQLKAYKFYGCWPSDISAIDLSYENVDQIEEFQVTFQYQWYDSLDTANTSILDTTETI
jgi:hypothetical protein